MEQNELEKIVSKEVDSAYEKAVADAAPYGMVLFGKSQILFYNDLLSKKELTAIIKDGFKEEIPEIQIVAKNVLRTIAPYLEHIREIFFKQRKEQYEEIVKLRAEIEKLKSK